jgi:DNA-binding MarR family transcriptional regulator
MPELPKTVAQGELGPGRQISAESVAALMEHVTRGLHSISFSAGLNPAQWNALRYLDRSNPSARNVTAFARHHMTKKSTASETITALMKKGLIEKDIDPEDARARSLTLTDKGRSLLRHDPYRSVIAALDARPVAELGTITTFLAEILRAVFKEAGDRTEEAPEDME